MNIKWIMTSCALLMVFQGTVEGAEGKFGIIANEKSIGETEFALRLQIAAKRLAYDTEIIQFDSPNLDYDHGFDFLLVMLPIPYHPYCPNYPIILHPMTWFNGNQLRPRFHNNDAFLVLLDDPVYTKDLNPSMKWYPTVHHHDYVETDPTHMLHFVAHWGNRRKSKKYKSLYSQLDKLDNMIFHGAPYTRELCPKHHRGGLPFDGCAVIEAIQSAGINLIFHSDTHLKHGIPSSRIFEAAASSSVIISDLNPFIIEHFGDSVLYVDQTQNARKMATTIKKHLNWIHDHPNEAKAMAKRAHTIYIENYILENQLLQLFEFHKKLMKEKENLPRI